jgi:DNA polymerase-3 subunit beta
LLFSLFSGNLKALSRKICTFAEIKLIVMKFIVPSQLLYKNLQTVSGIITTNNAIPIIENVLFQINDKKLKLTATDLETTITTEVDLSDADGDGEIVIPSKIVLETLKVLPDVPVIFNISDNFAIGMIAGESNYELVGYNSEEFPQKPELTNAASFEIDAKILGTAISKTIFATAGQESMRPVLTGIYCEIKPKEITFVATDAHKLVTYKHTSLETLTSDLETAFTIPKRPLMLLKNILQSYEGQVQIDFDETKVGFTLETISFVSKLIEGKFPDWNRVIPKNNTNILKVERLPFLQLMRSISPYANQSTHQIRLKIESTSMCLTAEDLEVSNRATATLPCIFEYGDEPLPEYIAEETPVDIGKETPEQIEPADEETSDTGKQIPADNIESTPFEIGFSSKFLQEMLNNIDSDDVIIKLSNHAVAGLIFPYQENEDEKQEHLLMLLMPVKLGS